MAELVDWVARFIHIFSGVMWVGGAFLWGMVVVPSVTKRVAPTARVPFLGTVAPRVARYLGIAGVLTVLSGFWVMTNITGAIDLAIDAFGGQDVPPEVAQWGRTLGGAVVLSLIMLSIGIYLWVKIPKVLDAMAKAPAGSPPPAEATAMLKRITMLSMVNITLGTIVLATMAWAVVIHPF